MKLTPLLNWYVHMITTLYSTVFHIQINGQTALHLAASEGFADVASLLHRKNSELMGILDDVSCV